MNHYTKLYTLAFVHDDKRVLLGMKKRGFGSGRWNGFGGKVHQDESIEEAAKRELLEECCLSVEKLQHVGIIKFEFVGKDQIMEVHVFKTTSFVGEPKETEEMRPQWFATDEIPFTKMWPDDIYWYHWMLEGQQFEGYFHFEGHDKILDYTLKKL